VLLDPGPFLLGEGARLVQDMVGDAHFADVVQVGAFGEAPEGGRAQAEALAEVDRQLGHPGRMAVGVGVAGLDGADQGSQGLGVAAADVGHRVAGEHPVQDRVQGAAAPVAGQDRVDRGHEAGEQEGVVVPPRQPPQGADLQRQQCPGPEQAGHHERQLDAAAPAPPAPPVHRPDRDQHGRRGHRHRQRAGRDGADDHQMGGRRPKDNVQGRRGP
jgi:hypothetical protein